MFNGRGALIYTLGSFYEGGFSSNTKEGEGVYKGIDGSIYEGEYQSDMKNGQGLFKLYNGDIYEGTFYNGLFDGEGIYKSSTRIITSGFKDGVLDGEAEIQYLDDNENLRVTLKGTFKKGLVFKFIGEIVNILSIHINEYSFGS